MGIADATTPQSRLPAGFGSAAAAPAGLLDALACHVAVLEPDGTVRQVNRTAADLIGLPRSLVVGRKPWDLPLPADFAVAAKRTFLSGIQPPLPRTLELPWPTADGERFISWTLAYLDDGCAIVLTGVDVTEKRRAINEARDERDFAFQVMNALGQGVAVEDADWRLRYVNPAFARMVGRDVRDLVGGLAIDLVAPGQREVVADAQARRDRGNSDAYEVTFQRPDGTTVPTLVSGTPWQQGGQPAGAIAVVTDLTAHKATARELAQRTSEAEALLEFSKLVELQTELESSASEAIGVLARAVPLDAAAFAFRRGERIELKVIWASERSRVPVGYATVLPKGEGVTWHVFDQGEPIYVNDYPAQLNASSEWLRLGLSSVAFLPLADGSLGDGVAFIGGRFQDAGPWRPRDRELLEAAARSARATIERFRRLRMVERAALEDALTGLGNRRAFDADLDAALSVSDRHREPFSVLAIDLDGLKRVNDTYGHERGDALLREFGRALRRSFRREDSVYRFGGDEFGVLLPRTGSLAHAGPLERVQVAIEIVREAGFPDFNASAGIASYPDEGNSTGEVARLADLRLYEDKLQHRAC